MGIAKTEKDWIAMKRLAIAIVAALITSVIQVPQSSLADDKKSRVTSINSTRAEKMEKVRCKRTDVKARYPKPVVMPKGVAKKLPRLITLDTNCGVIVIETLARDVPITLTAVNRFVRAGFYDRTLCHRLTTEDYFFLQCGDPTATGLGVPDFRYPAENLPTARSFIYSEGLVVMSNSSPGHNGSQFMIFYEDTRLPTPYTIWGKIVSGLEIVKYIAEGGVKGGGVDGLPIRTIAIERATSN